MTERGRRAARPQAQPFGLHRSGSLPPARRLTRRPVWRCATHERQRAAAAQRGVWGDFKQALRSSRGEPFAGLRVRDRPLGRIDRPLAAQRTLARVPMVIAVDGLACIARYAHERRPRHGPAVAMERGAVIRAMAADRGVADRRRFFQRTRPSGVVVGIAVGMAAGDGDGRSGVRDAPPHLVGWGLWEGLQPRAFLGVSL
jgi:hypothetical protein